MSGCMSGLMRPIRLVPVAVLLAGCSTTPTVGPIAFNKSSQTFTARLTPQIGLGDFDGDGDLDAVFATMGLQNSQVLMNDGTGQFIDSGQELTQQGHGVGVGDLDGDGDLDLFVTCAGWNDGEVEYDKPSRIYFNDGDGRADIFIAHFSPDDGTNEIWFNQTENHPTHRSQPAHRETSSPR
jgi:hypothetical protein